MISVACGTNPLWAWGRRVSESLDHASTVRSRRVDFRFPFVSFCVHFGIICRSILQSVFIYLFVDLDPISTPFWLYFGSLLESFWVNFTSGEGSWEEDPEMPSRFLDVGVSLGSPWAPFSIKNPSFFRPTKKAALF